MIDWGQTPDWLNRRENLALAHRKKCNSQLAMAPEEIALFLVDLGLNLEESPAVQAGLLKVELRPEGYGFDVNFGV